MNQRNCMIEDAIKYVNEVIGVDLEIIRCQSGLGSTYNVNVNDPDQSALVQGEMTLRDAYYFMLGIRKAAELMMEKR